MRPVLQHKYTSLTPGQTRVIEAALVGVQYDVAPDEGLVVNALTGDTPPLTLLGGWRSLLKQ
jgi:hypothetical protein